ncbi:MAG: hypothetical protein Q9163_006449 [Psora crenata]
MAPTSTNTTSSIGLALAGMTESVNIPKPRDAGLWAGKESFAAVAAKPLPIKNKTAGLPTPPNSISPSLPPQTDKDRSSRGPPTPPAAVHLDSDIDLEDAVEHAKAQDSPQRGLTARRLRSLESPDAVGDITPTMLAKHHLPGILLENGPLAIRHIMGYLTTSVPGFSGIPPAKARRLVVGALEGRGIDGQPGGLNGEIIFEKVGWGRWDARKRGRPSRAHPAAPSLMGVQIPSSHRYPHRTHDVPCGSHPSDTTSDDTPVDEHSAPEHEVDKMSLDDELCTSPPPAAGTPAPEDLDDVTDEEDWASIGAAALRQGSCPLTGGILSTHRRRYQPYVEPKSRGRGITKKPSSKTLAKSMPISTNSVYNGKHQQQQQTKQAAVRESMDMFTGAETGFGRQDREAVEALLKLSSV